MISRYTYPKMGDIWELPNRYQAMLDVEIAACKAMHTLGIIPAADLNNIVNKAGFDVKRIAEIEAETKHDVIAFLTSVSEHVGPSSRYIHYGMTSSDVLDTATAIQLKQAGELIMTELHNFCKVLKIRAYEHKDTLCIGRSHGIHAEPTSFGLKFALYYDEMQRNIVRLTQAIKIIAVGQISGAVGNYVHLAPQVEELACAHLGLSPVNIASQVIQRDRHAEYMNTLAIISSSIEKVAMEIRHLQRTEVLEAEENFGKKQKGSSAMPHKRNPIVTEQMCGMARLIRANAMAALENNALWHERDISHSSVERVILPDSTIIVHYQLIKMTKLIKNLLLYPQQMMRNIELTNGLVFSQVALLKLAKIGVSREDSYLYVQRNAMVCWQTKENFRSLLETDADITKLLTKADFDEIFSYERYLAQTDFIYNRVFI